MHTFCDFANRSKLSLTVTPKHQAGTSRYLKRIMPACRSALILKAASPCLLHLHIMVGASRVLAGHHRAEGAALLCMHGCSSLIRFTTVTQGSWGGHRRKFCATRNTRQLWHAQGGSQSGAQTQRSQSRLSNETYLRSQRLGRCTLRHVSVRVRPCVSASHRTSRIT